MKKTIAILLAAVFVMTMLTGCHGAKARKVFEIPEKLETAEPIEITFWAKNDTNKAQTDIYAKAIADFEKLYPNVKVNIRLYTDYGKIYNDVITNISTGTTPNVCITYPDHIATYMTGENVVIPLDDLIKDDRFGMGGSELLFDGPERDEMVESFMQEGRIDHLQYAMPFVRSTEACYINKTYVEKLGYEIPDILTWDFIWEVSEAAMAKDAEGNYLVNGQNIMIPFIYKSTDNMMIQSLYQQGAEYSDELGNIGIFNDDTKKILYKVSEEVAKGCFSTFKISSYPANFVNAGQCIFAVDSTAGATWMGSEAPLMDISADKLVNFETEVRVVPQYDPKNPAMISQGPSVCIFNKEDPQEVLASWLFVQYLLTDDVQIAYAETEGYVPVTIRAQESPEYQDYLSRAGEDNNKYYDVKIKAAKLLLENEDNTFVTPVFNGSASLRDAAGQMIENVAKSTRRKQKVDEAYLSSMFDDVASLYRLDQVTKAQGAEGTRDLGPLSATAKVMIGTFVLTWTLIIGYVVRKWIKDRKEAQNG